MQRHGLVSQPELMRVSWSAIPMVLMMSWCIKAQPPEPPEPGTRRFPEIENPQIPPRPPRVESLALSPDGKVAVTGSEDGTITLWQARDGAVLHVIKAHAPTPYFSQRAIFSPDSKSLFTLGIKLANNEVAAGAIVKPGDKPRTPTSQAQLWDVQSGKLLWTLPNLEKADRQPVGLGLPVFSPDGKFLATAGRYSSAGLWNAQTGEFLRALKVPFLELNALTFSPDSTTLCGAGHRNEWATSTTIAHETGEVLLWDCATGALLRSLRHPEVEMSDEIYAVAFSPDGTLLATGGAVGRPEKLNEASGRFNVQWGEARLWDVKSGALLMSMGKQAHRQGVHTLSFSPDGKRLATGSRDQTVRLWDVTTARLLGTVTRYGTEDVQETIETKPGQPGVRREEIIKQGPDGQSSTSASQSTIKEINAAGVTTIKRITTTITGRGVKSLVFSPDGGVLHILSNDKTVRSWKVGDDQPIESDPARRILPAGSDAALSAFAFTPDGRTLASVGYDKKVRLWGTQRLEEKQAFRAHKDAVRAVAFAPRPPERPTFVEGETLLATSSTLLDWRKDGDNSASGYPTGFETKLWDYQTGNLLRTWTVNGFTATALAFSPDAKWLAAAGGYIGPPPRGAVAENGVFGVEVRGGGAANEPESIQSLNGIVKVWNVASGELLHELIVAGDMPSALAYSPDGTIIAGDCGEEGLMLWNAANGELIRAIDTDRPPPLKPGERRMRMRIGEPRVGRSLAFFADGKLLARSRKDKVQLWNVQTGALERTLIEQKSGAPEYIAFSPNGQLLATLGALSPLKIWEAQTGKLLWQSPQARVGTMLEFSPDGKALATDQEGSIRLWDITQAQQGVVQ